MITKPLRIDLALPKSWNHCTTAQLELIADVLREQVERIDRYHPFSMQNVKVALFFALAGIEILEGPNPRVPVEDQYYTVRLISKSRWCFNAFLSEKSEPFSLYLYQINYWLNGSPLDSEGNLRTSSQKDGRGGALLSWLDNDNGQFLTNFPYPLIKRRRSRWRYNALIGKKFQGPLTDLDGFSWAQYRFAQDTMASYVQISNNLVKMQQMGTFSVTQLATQKKSVDLARSMFLATIFNAKTRFVDTTTNIIKNDYHYEANQCSDNAQYFRNFPDTQWQVILFWWTGIMHTLSKRYPHVFKVQKTAKSQKPSSAMEVYTATIATMQKYVGINEQECNNQSYSLVLEQLERIAKENEDLERLRKKK